MSVVLLESLAPVEWRELEDAARRPTREETEEVAQVRAGLDAEHLAAREQRDEGGAHCSGFVGADEEPVDPAFGLSAQSVLGDVVADGQLPVVEEAHECGALV